MAVANHCFHFAFNKYWINRCAFMTLIKIFCFLYCLVVTHGLKLNPNKCYRLHAFHLTVNQLFWSFNSALLLGTSVKMQTEHTNVFHVFPLATDDKTKQEKNNIFLWSFWDELVWKVMTTTKVIPKHFDYYIFNLYFLQKCFYCNI